MAGQGTVLAEMGGGWLQCVDDQGMYYYNEYTEQSTEVWPPPAMPTAQAGYMSAIAPQYYAQPAQSMQYYQQQPAVQYAAQPAYPTAQPAYPTAQPMMMLPQSMMQQQPMQMQPQMMMPQAPPTMQQPLPQMNLASVPSMVVMPSAGMPGMPAMPPSQYNLPQAASMVAVPNVGAQPILSGTTKQADPEAALASSVVNRDRTDAVKSAVATKSKKTTKKKKSGWGCC
eukprot:TRINITY_DN115_c0_g1_i1.p1 TRINITY_DN115_c0_g1~~TRINITY_DN115_c0_g1_i1.p1  ORF type:complete len:250 (-),score=50.54 TRINITY_DN115_c0_g1_i1:158-838(-)